MINEFKPTWMINSIYNIDPKQLKKFGIRAVFTDLDNTLIAWNNPDGTQQLKDWMTRLNEQQIPLIVISNNSAKRVQRAVAPLNLPFISRALKPLGYGIKRALTKLDLAPTEVVMVGDQLLTDMVAANQAGVYSILVKPLINTDAWNTSINRFMEKFIMKKLLNTYHTLHWQEDLND